MKKVICITLLVSTVLSLFAQQQGVISGTVADEHGILPGANVSIKGTDKGTTTDENGFFQLKLGLPIRTERTLIVSYLGYKTHTQKVFVGEENIRIRLQEDATNLGEVVISAKGKARQRKEEAMPTSVITMQQLSGKVANIGDVLAKTAGVTIRNTGGLGSTTRLSLRGLEGKRIGFFIDETPLSSNSDFVSINDIPVDMIERIEIYEGVVPARFGGNAMGGAVNIVTKEYPEKYADVGYSYGSFNTHKVNAIVKRNLKAQGLLLGAGGFYTYADNDYLMKSPYRKDLTIQRNHDAFEKKLIGVGIKATKWWFDELGFEAVYIGTYKEIQGIKTDIREAHTKGEVFALTNDLTKDNFLIEGLDFDMSSALAFTHYQFIDKATKRYDWDGNAYPTPSQHGGELTIVPSNSNNKSVNFINKTNVEYLINEQHSLNANSVFSAVNSSPKDELRALSIGKETLYDAQMRSWVGGLTYDFRTANDKFLNSLTFRAYHYQMSTQKADRFSRNIEDIAINKQDYGLSNALRYKFLPELMGKFSFGRDTRIPSQNELLGDGVFVQPAETLLPEQNTSVNLGLLYTQNGGHNIQVELSGFYMYLENMIRFTKSFFGAQYQNFGKMRTLGVEAEIKADVCSFLYAYANATYQDLRDVRKFEPNSRLENPTKNKRMPNIPYLMANAGLEFHKENLFGGEGQNTRLFADMSFIEEYYYDFEMTKLSKRRIPRTLTCDVGFEHSFMNQRVFLSGNIKNLFNSEIMTEFNRPLPRRNFNIKLRWVFR